MSLLQVSADGLEVTVSYRNINYVVTNSITPAAGLYLAMYRIPSGCDIEYDCLVKPTYS